MDSENRRRCRNQYMRDIKESFGITKADLLAAVDGLDDYFETNATAVNQAIPQPARTALSASQKSLLVAYIATRRAGKLKTEEDG